MHAHVTGILLRAEGDRQRKGCSKQPVPEYLRRVCGLATALVSRLPRDALADGTIERVSLGDAVTVNEAIVKRTEFKEQVRLGSYVKPSVKQPAPTVATVEDLKAPYLIDYGNRGGKDSSQLEIAWARLKPMFASLPVTQVSTALINEYIASRKSQDMKNATINRELALLKAMLHHGARVTPPMVAAIPFFPRALKESKPRQGFIDPPKYAALQKECKPLWLRTLVTAAYSLGFRKCELLNLRKRDLDFLGKEIRFRMSHGGLEKPWFQAGLRHRTEH